MEATGTRTHGQILGMVQVNHNGVISAKVHFSLAHWLNRKNCCVPEMGLVTVFCPLTTTGTGELVVQIADEPRFVVDCRFIREVCAFYRMGRYGCA